jgi:hypothetical protein
LLQGCRRFESPKQQHVCTLGGARRRFKRATPASLRGATAAAAWQHRPELKKRDRARLLRMLQCRAICCATLPLHDLSRDLTTPREPWSPCKFGLFTSALIVLNALKDLVRQEAGDDQTAVSAGVAGRTWFRCQKRGVKARTGWE